MMKTAIFRPIFHSGKSRNLLICAILAAIFAFPATAQECPLCDAAENGNIAEVRRLLDNGEKINAVDNYSNTALIEAAGEGHTEIAKILLNSGAKVNAANNSDFTALMGAAFAGHTEIAKILLDNGAKVNVADDTGYTALIWAASRGHTEIVKILLDNDANVNVADKHDNTALIWAATLGYTEIAKMLLDNGANVNVVDKYGYTALIWAAKEYHAEIAKMLLDNDANTSNPSAQFSIGFWHYNGEFGEVNKREAFRWYRKAAEQGNKEAQNNLGVMYWRGEGVIENEYESYIWHAIAKANGDEDAAKALRGNKWSSYLTTTEIKKAKREAERRLAAIENGEALTQESAAPAGEVAAATPPKGANIAEKVYENAWRSIVVIRTANGQGSGVIIRPNIVATNCHVLEGGGEITIYKHDNRRASTDTLFSATVRKQDEDNDFCLLDVSGLWGIPAALRKYNTLKIGEDVYALGSPKGLDLSLSTGIISQLRRGKIARYIQTDAAISPGSSGGGLFDSEGNLIGILTSKIADEDVEGIGFAIPADLALNL